MNPRRQRLATRLREVRATHYASGNAFAAAIGWVQSRVSKLETGAQLPTEEDIHAWTRTCREGDDVTNELLTLLADARIEYVNARDVQRATGLANYQAELGGLELRATRICDWQPNMIPGLVQTADYARELLSLPGGPLSNGATEDDIEALVAERIRRQNILYQRDKSVVLVLAEAALYSPPASAEVLRAQLDRLVTVAGLSTVTIAVLPLRAPMPSLPTGSFTIHDDAFVLIETLTAQTRLDQPDEVKVYRECFDHLLRTSVRGGDAVALIADAGHRGP